MLVLQFLSGSRKIRLPSPSPGFCDSSIYDAHKMRWAWDEHENEMSCVARPFDWDLDEGVIKHFWLMIYVYDSLPVPAGAFSRGPRGCQAQPNQGVEKYHTLRLPDPNSSANFSDEPNELGWLIRIWMSPIERLNRKRRSPPNPDESNRTRPAQ